MQGHATVLGTTNKPLALHQPGYLGTENAKEEWFGVAHANVHVRHVTFNIWSTNTHQQSYLAHCFTAVRGV